MLNINASQNFKKMTIKLEMISEKARKLPEPYLVKCIKFWRIAFSKDYMYDCI